MNILSKNQQNFLKKIYIIFIVGIILSVISVFLPWYSFEISLLGKNFNWNYSPLEGWSFENSYELTPPNMSALTPYFYIIFVYAGIMLSVLLINMTTGTKQENKYIPNLIFCGAILSGFTFFLFMYLLISQNFFVPYLQIDQIAGELVQTRIYSMNIGSVIAFFSVIPLIFAASSFKTSYINSFSDEEDQTGEERGEFNSTEKEKINDNSLNLTPREEYQLLEEKFIEARMNTIEKKKKNKPE